MNATLPHSMAQALAPFAPANSVVHKIIGSTPMFQRCGHSAAPITGDRFVYKLSGVELVCDMDYESAEQASRDCYGLPEHPNTPASAYVMAAYVRDVNVEPMLTEEQRDEIQSAFLKQVQ